MPQNASRKSVFEDFQVASAKTLRPDLSMQGSLLCLDLRHMNLQHKRIPSINHAVFVLSLSLQVSGRSQPPTNYTPPLEPPFPETQNRGKLATLRRRASESPFPLHRAVKSHIAGGGGGGRWGPFLLVCLRSVRVAELEALFACRLEGV